MTDTWIDKLSDYLDDEMSPAERALLEERLADDQELADTLEGLRRVKIHGQAVDDQVPPHAQSIWDGVAQRIGATGSVPRDQGPIVGLITPWRSRRVPISVPQLIAASVALIVLSGGGAMMIQRFGADLSTTGLPFESAVVSAATRTAFASIGATRYDQAVADLTLVLEARRQFLDQETIDVLEENLAIIDRAIERSLEALRTAPQSDYLRSHIEQTMRQKMTLLQHATARSSSL